MSTGRTIRSPDGGVIFLTKRFDADFKTTLNVRAPRRYSTLRVL
jgi:hypothetical protein